MAVKKVKVKKKVKKVAKKVTKLVGARKSKTALTAAQL